MRLTGTVARVTDFGAFVTVAPGIDGLVHVSEAAPHRVAHVREVLTAGQSVEVVVLQVEPGKRRLSLSVKRAMEPEAPAAESGPAGEAAPGRVAHGAREGAGVREGREGRERAPRRFPERGGREERGDRGGRRDRGAGAGGGGRPDRAGRGGRSGRGEREESPDRSFSGRDESGGDRMSEIQRNAPSEPTTMALALRKAMEEAERKQRESSS
jgi:predicted RNA-binding protein with RPS1 domain